MHLFYQPEIEGDRVFLSPEESTHLSRVLRVKKGDNILLTDGRGHLYEATVTDPDPHRSAVSVNKSIPGKQERGNHLHIGIAPTKNTDRFEWFLEKATEIGVGEITPLICSRSEKTTIRTDRMQKILVSAMKQSQRMYLPVLHTPAGFNTMVRQPFEGQKFIAWCDTEKRENLSKLCKKSTNIRILIGPEGDFSPEEVETAEKEGYIPVSLGKTRLRTETAGLIACHTILLNLE